MVVLGRKQSILHGSRLVTAVQITLSNQPSDWKKEWQEREDENKRIAVKPLVAAE